MSLGPAHTIAMEHLCETVRVLKENSPNLSGTMTCEDPYEIMKERHESVARGFKSVLKIVEIQQGIIGSIALMVQALQKEVHDLRNPGQIEPSDTTERFKRLADDKSTPDSR